MRGEIGFSNISLQSERDFVRPKCTSGTCFDLGIHGSDGDLLWIIGDKDWAYLAIELLQPIHDEAKKIIEDVQKTIQEAKASGKQIRMIELGGNDKRIMDIHYGGSGKCKQINGIPVVVDYEKLNHVGYMIDYEEEIPFIAKGGN